MGVVLRVEGGALKQCYDLFVCGTFVIVWLWNISLTGWQICTRARSAGLVRN